MLLPTAQRLSVALLIWGLSAIPAAAQSDADLDLERLTAELLPRAQALSGLEARRPLNVAGRTREEFAQFLNQRLAEEIETSGREAVGIVYNLLDLIPASLDLTNASTLLLAEQVLGYFDPRTDSLYVMEDVSVEQLRPVLVHEMVHGLQHQYVPLDSLMEPAMGGDRLMAARAAFEGHAELVEAIFTIEELTSEPASFTDLPDLTRAPMEFFFVENPRPLLAAAPVIVRDGMIFPYIRGAGFVQALWRRDPAAVPFRDMMPQSTEQVIDPEQRFFGVLDPPTEIIFADPARGTPAIGADPNTIADPAASSPTGGTAGSTPWSVVYENTLGQFELSVLLRERHVQFGAEKYAVGWAGDRYRLLHDGERHILLWYLVWDDARAASGFANAYRQILGRRLNRSGRVEEMTVDGRPVVRIVEAPEELDYTTVPAPEIRFATERE